MPPKFQFIDSICYFFLLLSRFFRFDFKKPAHTKNQKKQERNTNRLRFWWADWINVWNETESKYCLVHHPISVPLISLHNWPRSKCESLAKTEQAKHYKYGRLSRCDCTHEDLMFYSVSSVAKCWSLIAIGICFIAIKYVWFCELCDLIIFKFINILFIIFVHYIFRHIVCWCCCYFCCCFFSLRMFMIVTTFSPEFLFNVIFLLLLSD